MTSPYRKKLIEVALPLAAINAESAREKSIRHGHPSTLHLWWARRPLAACRAVLFSSLVDDPDSDPQYHKPDGSVDEEAAGIKRADLFNLIEELVMWENSNNVDVIRTARAEIARCVASRLIETGALAKEFGLAASDSGLDAERAPATAATTNPNSKIHNQTWTAWDLVTKGHCRPNPTGFDAKVGRVRFSFDVSRLPPADVVNAFLATHAPPVLDPFAGGGSIPLEAQRLGLRAYASDLNPVPVLINKALIEIPPKFAGRPPVNPQARNEQRENRSEKTETRAEGAADALSRVDRVAEGNGGGEGALPPRSDVAARGDLRDAVTDHTGNDLRPGEHRRGLDTGVETGKGSVPVNRAGIVGRSGDAADALRATEVVSRKRNLKPQTAAGRSQPDADNHAAASAKRDLSKEKKGAKTKSASVTSHSSSLFPREWPGATGLAEDVRYYGKWMRDEAEKRIDHLYPKVEVTAEMAQERPDLLPYVGQQLTVIAWLWAKTVASPNPAARGTHTPLVKSFWLAKKARNKAWLEPRVNKADNSYRFAIKVGADGPGTGTVNRKGGRCLITDTPIPFDHVRNEGKAGRLGSTLLAVVAEGNSGRVYLEPNEVQILAAKSAKPSWVPEAELAYNPFALRPPLYGATHFKDLFTLRQLVALTTFADLVQEVRDRILLDAKQPTAGANYDSSTSNDSDITAYADGISVYLSFVVNKLADLANAQCAWEPIAQCPRHLFGRQAIPMIWDFAEGNPMSSSSGSWDVLMRNTLRSLESPLMPFPQSAVGVVRQLDAVAAANYGHSFVISTDPPYYNNIDYADLSDFFYVWLRKCLGRSFPSLFATLLTPKTPELVATPYRHDGSKDKARRFFEDGLGASFRSMREIQSPEIPLTVFYAFKQAEEDEDVDDDDGPDEQPVSSTGWETMLEGLIDAGFLIRGTWPMRTEMASRMMGMGMNALASSIVLVCRPRPGNAALATRKEFITALRRELPEALRNLQRGNIAPVDLAQAAIGPGMAVFTRYAKVLESDGSPMTVRTALGLINQSLDEVLAEQEGEFDGDTRWALAWFEQFGMEDGPFGDAETLSKAKNTAVNGLEEAGIITARAGKVRLVKRDELPLDWNPAKDKRLTVWEVTQHLIHRLDQKGETGAAELVGQLGGIAEISRDLAYRLYSTCDRKKWAQEALAYNSLVVAWPELTKLARRRTGDRGQGRGNREQSLFGEEQL